MSISNLDKWRHKLPQYQHGKQDLVAYSIILIALGVSISYFGYIGILYVVLLLFVLAVIGEVVTKIIKKYRDSIPMEKDKNEAASNRIYENDDHATLVTWKPGQYATYSLTYNEDGNEKYTGYSLRIDYKINEDGGMKIVAVANEPEFSTISILTYSQQQITGNDQNPPQVKGPIIYRNVNGDIVSYKNHLVDVLNLLTVRNMKGVPKALAEQPNKVTLPGNIKETYPLQDPWQNHVMIHELSPQVLITSVARSRVEGRDDYSLMVSSFGETLYRKYSPEDLLDFVDLSPPRPFHYPEFSLCHPVSWVLVPSNYNEISIFGALYSETAKDPNMLGNKTAFICGQPGNNCSFTLCIYMFNTPSAQQECENKLSVWDRNMSLKHVTTIDALNDSPIIDLYTAEWEMEQHLVREMIATYRSRDETQSAAARFTLAIVFDRPDHKEIVTNAEQVVNTIFRSFQFKKTSSKDNLTEATGIGEPCYGYHGEGPDAYVDEIKSLIAGENKQWVIFEYGTVVIVTDTSGNSLEQSAKSQIAALGKSIPGTPAGDFKVYKLDNNSGWIVRFQDPNIFTFVGTYEVSEDAEDIYVGMVGMNKKDADVERNKIIGSSSF